MFKKKNESGRSMVEMLGVLAIIGVLSIGGIAGYTLSMRRHRVNQILDAVNKYALIVYGACQKAIIDGDIQTITQCGSQYPVKFRDSGLASITDLHSIEFMYITSSSGEDHVNINLGFNDDKICIAARTSMGLTGTNSNGSCYNNSFPFSFK